MSLQELQVSMGATLADDGIPLHFGDLKAEYQAARHTAVLLDRSHEGRLEVSGADRFDLLHRMSTNDLLNMQPGEGRPTIFTNPNARILDRVLVYNWMQKSLLLIAGPGRGDALRSYLQRNIFFNDDVRLKDLTDRTKHFALHGPGAGAVLQALVPDVAELRNLYGMAASIAGAEVFIGRRKPLSAEHWIINTPSELADAVWQALIQAGEPLGLRPAGGLTYNTLRVRAGEPGVGHELTEKYIPLEVGLWDEISFSKGCYTGQEIIARMESRNRLARTIVSLALEKPLEAPMDLFHEGRRAGTITSSVVSPDNEIFAIGVVKTDVAEPENSLNVGQPDGTSVRVESLIGAQPREPAE